MAYSRTPDAAIGGALLARLGSEESADWGRSVLLSATFCSPRPCVKDPAGVVAPLRNLRAIPTCVWVLTFGTANGYVSYTLACLRLLQPW